jgi:hypothetical protein
MIKHLDLENPGSFVEPSSQADIRLARARVSGRMESLQNENELREIAERILDPCPAGRGIVLATSCESCGDGSPEDHTFGSLITPLTLFLFGGCVI